MAYFVAFTLHRRRDHLAHSTQASAAPMDRAGHEQLLLGFYAGIPDAQHTIDEVFADGDSVAVRFTIRGTHTGDLFGMPASNRPVSVVAIHGTLRRLARHPNLGR